MKKSKFFSLNQRDFIRGFFVAIATGALTAIYNAITSGGTIELHWDKIGLIAIASGISYLLKNLVTNSQDQLFTKEP